MKALIVSDLHSNEPALDAVMGRVRRKHLSQMICLGDFVGYGGQPNQVVDRMRTFRGRKRYVRGNHDRVASGIEDGMAFNHAARAAALWTRTRLSGLNRAFLWNLPSGPVIEDGIALCHGSPFDEDEYVFSAGHARDILMNVNARLVFFGHTHLPVIYSIDGRGNVEGGPPVPGVVIHLDPERRYLINPGSVGQPRDRNTDASFATIDLEALAVRFMRVSYDISNAQEAIVRAGLPRMLADRLAIGA
ncbi:MAG TPA: metallophosphoesterase family protein [Thermoanaerobaculia bacterium]|nr:metallophosphoesterase family protein [Thermoanaerobaculia bacterium]